EDARAGLDRGAAREARRRDGRREAALLPDHGVRKGGGARGGEPAGVARPDGAGERPRAEADLMLFYRLLLRLYPSSFRAEYGEDMRAIFEERWKSASGAGERLALLAEAAADVFPNALRVHAELLRQDTRYTLRTLARSPGFAATAIAVTALGIGATTATFSIADHVLLRPLPYREPERLVKFWSTP